MNQLTRAPIGAARDRKVAPDGGRIRAVKPFALTSILTAASIVGSGAGSGVALAQEEPAASEEMPVEETEPRMTLPAGRALLQGYLELNLSSDLVGKPISLAPDLWYGVNDDITVGLVHSSHATTGFFGGAGDGICFVSEEDGCPEVLQNTAVAGRYHLTSEPVALAADAALVVRQLDPFQLALKAGVVGKWQSGAISALFAANLFVGVTEREVDGGVMVEAGANKEDINLPVAVMYALSPELSLGVQTGVFLPLSETADTYLIPLSLGARYMVSPQISVDALFSFPALIGGPEETGADFRVLTLGAGYAL